MSCEVEDAGAGGWVPDEVDMQILDCYRYDAECPKSRIAAIVNKPESTVRGRIRRLKELGVLRFRAVINNDSVMAHSVEAYIEVSFPGDADVHASLLEVVRHVKSREIRDAITLIGDVDALVRVRTRDVPALRDLVTRIRKHPLVAGTRTRIVAGNRWYGAEDEDGSVEPAELVAG